MIHRDHRKHYESASALGQIVYREGPSKLSYADADGISLKRLRSGLTLLRVIEQKNRGHTLGWAQNEILRTLDATIAHARICPGAADLRLDPRSGVFLVRGEIAAAYAPDLHTSFNGEQVIERLHDGRVETVTTHEEFFRFLDPQDSERRVAKRRHQSSVRRSGIGGRNRGDAA